MQPPPTLDREEQWEQALGPALCRLRAYDLRVLLGLEDGAHQYLSLQPLSSPEQARTLPTPLVGVMEEGQWAGQV